MHKGILMKSPRKLKLTVTTNHRKVMLLKINWNKTKHLLAFASHPVEISYGTLPHV